MATPVNSSRKYSNYATKISQSIDECKLRIQQGDSLNDILTFVNKISKQTDGVIKEFSDEVSPLLNKSNKNVKKNGWFSKKLVLIKNPLISEMDKKLVVYKKSFDNRKIINNATAKTLAEKKTANNLVTANKKAANLAEKKRIANNLAAAKKITNNSADRAKYIKQLNNLQRNKIGIANSGKPPSQPPSLNTVRRQKLDSNIKGLTNLQKQLGRTSNQTFKNFVDSGRNASSLNNDRVARIRSVINKVKGTNQSLMEGI